VRVNGLSSLAITKIDVLGGLKRIPICTKYKIGKKIIDTMPASLDVFRKCQPVYEYVPGWGDLNEQDFITIVKKGYKALPANMKKYIKKIESEIKVPVELISVGPDRKATIKIK
jgi:adenylosuccinate synthase